MNKLELTDEQLLLVERALDFYSRVGIGQFEVIKEHPTFESYLYEVCIPKKEPEVGDRTPQGKILEVKDGKALINGSVDKKTRQWSSKSEWKKLKDVKLSTDFNRYHEIRKTVDVCLNQPRNDTCRMSFDMVQVIRHERWKRNPNRSEMTVDSSIHFSHRKDDSSSKIICVMDKPEVEKIEKIDKEF